MTRLLQNPRILLPLIIVIGMMIFALRANDVWTAAASGQLFARQAHAADAKPDAAPAPAAAAPTITPPTLANAPAEGAKPAEAAKSADTPNLTGGDAAKDDEDVSPAEMEVLKQLAQRREELDKRAKELDTREALLKVAEQRVDQKIKELSDLRTQLQAMVNQVGEKQTAQLENLVKVYETMKPDDAAKIFDTLEMPILLNVIERMKAKSTAPIMAKMTPEKAKQVTVALTKQDQLPQVK